MNPYTTLLKRLFSVNLFGGMKLGLNNCLRLDKLLGSPSKAFSSIHIAGTNGKGSVATKVAAALQATGLRVGLYTSPHISSFRERIRINHRMISEEQTKYHLDQIFSILDKEKIPCTFFEITTLLCFAYFAQEKVDIAVIEAGLGGRLDATNILCPQLSVITSISLEHTEFLGNTIEAIAKEKAGIIKPSTPVIIGPNVPREVIESVSIEKGSPCFQVEGNFYDYQSENEAIAQAALTWLQVDPPAIEAGIQALPCCRMEAVSNSVILDAAHNPDGFKKLLTAIRHRIPFSPLRMVVGLSGNKDIDGCLNIFKDVCMHFHLVEANTARAAPKELLRDRLLAIGVPDCRITCEETTPSAVANALAAANKQDQVVVVCGTFFIMKDARKALGIEEPQDPFEMNESYLFNPGLSR